MIQSSIFMKYILPEFKKLTMQSQSQSMIFIEQIIEVYFFAKKESQVVPRKEDMKKMDELSQQNYHSLFHQRILEFLFQVIVDTVVNNKTSTNSDRFEKHT